MAHAFHGEKKRYVDFHHLTEIPASLASWQAKHRAHKSMETELADLEGRLHIQMQSRCTTDKQMFKLIKHIFCQQHRRANKDGSRMTGVDKADFYQILTIMGMHCTQAVSDALFEKYDRNGSGQLSVPEFWLQYRPQDYVGLPGFTDTEKYKREEKLMNRGKRMYIRESLTHTAVQPRLPHHSVYMLPIESLLEGIRDKIRMNSVSDQTLSSARTRRYLSKLFEYGDPDGTGSCDANALEVVLNKLNFEVGSHYVNVLMQHYPFQHDRSRLDYRALCLAVYPIETTPPMTSCYIQNDAGVAMVHRMENGGVGQMSMHASGAMTARVPSRSRSRAHSRLGSAGAQTFRAETPRPPSSGSGRAISRVGSRAGSRPGSRSVSRTSYMANAARPVMV